MPCSTVEKQRASSKRYYAANAPALRAYSKAYHAKHKADPEYKARAVVRARIQREKDYRGNALRGIKGRAKRRGIPFDITVTDLEWPTHCPVLGLELDYSVRTKGGKPRPNSPSVDRFDARKGYVRGNVQVISFRANAIKTNATPQELRAVADYFGCLE